MYGYVYKTTNLINNKVYIGQHKHSNWDNRYIGSGKVLEIAIQKYGKENFCCELVEECSTQEQLNDREIYWIAFYRKTNRCYNIANGGGGRSCNLSEETKKKLSTANKGKKLSAETKMKMAKSRMGTSLSEETKMKISKIHKGKKLSNEHREKLSKSHKGVPHPHSEEWRKKVSTSAKGKVISEETKIKMSLAKSGKNHPNYGKHLSEETRKKISENKRKKSLTRPPKSWGYVEDLGGSMKAIFENEKAIFYENEITKSLTKDCTRDFRDLEPINCRVYICEEKENHNKRYVLFNEKGEPIEEDCTLDGIGIKIETLRYLKTNGEITL